MPTYTERHITIETRSHGGRAWIAEITGTDPKFGMARDFIRKADVTAARSNTYRDLEFTLPRTEGAIFEYKDLGGSSRGGDCGFWIVRDGRLAEITRAEVLDILTAPQPEPPAPAAPVQMPREKATALVQMPREKATVPAPRQSFGVTMQGCSGVETLRFATRATADRVRRAVRAWVNAGGWSGAATLRAVAAYAATAFRQRACAILRQCQEINARNSAQSLGA